MINMSRSIVIAIILTLFLNDVYSSCYWNNYNPYRLFATKTDYNSVRGDIRDSVKLTLLQDCKPLSIWGLFRHAKRYPNKKYSKYIKKVMSIQNGIIARHEAGLGSLCVQDVENLRNWKVNKLYGMTKEGLSEMAGIGHRIREAFQDLLKNLKSHQYTFRSNKYSYIRDSVDGFLKGFKGTYLKVDHPRIRDVMAPYEDCDLYNKTVRNNQTTFAQAQMYLNLEEYLQSKVRVQNRTGIILSNEELTFLYDLCRKTWSGVENKPSPWCALFDEEDLKIQEYYEDLRLYYRNGYGNEWNVEFGQIPLADMLKTFKSQKETPRKKITAYFTHGVMLSMAYSALGLFRDDKPLTAARDVNRKWRTSEHAPFSGNLVAVLNKCNKNGTDNFAVAFYMNEQPLDEFCTNGVCTWEKFEEILSPMENKTSENVCNKNL